VRETLPTPLRAVPDCVRTPWTSRAVKKRVLIIEDEISIRESLVDLFASADVLVVAAATLAEAKAALFAELPLDLIVTDLRLGGNRDGGLQVLAAAGMVHQSTPVIVLTAYPDDDNRHASERLSATYFLEKPVDLSIIAKLARDHGVSSVLSPPEHPVAP
jgi:DNA-binding NtrC family response regulator